MLELWDNDLNEKELSDISNNIMSKEIKKIASKLSTASRAHITIALAYGVSAVQTGYDLLSILACLTTDECLKEKNPIDCKEHELTYLGSARCYIKLKEPIYIDSIFSQDFY